MTGLPERVLLAGGVRIEKPHLAHLIPAKSIFALVRGDAVIAHTEPPPAKWALVRAVQFACIRRLASDRRERGLLGRAAQVALAEALLRASAHSVQAHLKAVGLVREFCPTITDVEMALWLYEAAFFPFCSPSVELGELLSLSDPTRAAAGLRGMPTTHAENGGEGAMSGDQNREPLVTVRRQWNDFATAEYRLSGIDGVHWDSVSGGVGAQALRPFLHGYVMCDGAVSGGVSHSCSHGPAPHRIKVCIVKRDNAPAVMHAINVLRVLNEQIQVRAKASVLSSTERTQMMLTARDEVLRAYEAFCRTDEIVSAVGLGRRAAEALAEHGIDSRERLLSASLDELKRIRGVGKAAVEKICVYRAKFPLSHAAG